MKSQTFFFSGKSEKMYFKTSITVCTQSVLIFEYHSDDVLYCI